MARLGSDFTAAHVQVIPHDGVKPECFNLRVFFHIFVQYCKFSEQLLRGEIIGVGGFCFRLEAANQLLAFTDYDARTPAFTLRVPRDTFEL